MNPLKWLDLKSPVKREPPLPYLEAEPTHLQWLAELIYVNQGKTNIQSIGQIQRGVGVYGRVGLNLLESFALAETWAFLLGMVIGSKADEIVSEAIQDKIQKEIERVEKLSLEPRLELPPSSIVLPSKGDTVNLQGYREAGPRQRGPDLLLG